MLIPISNFSHGANHLKAHIPMKIYTKLILFIYPPTAMDQMQKP
jgi:hypothetical protein